MSISSPTPEALKEKAKLIRQFMTDRCNAQVSHSQCLELVSQIFGFKDWNTASALSKSEPARPVLPTELKTVADLKRALESFKDTARIGAGYDFNLGEFLDELEDIDTPETTFFQEFSLGIERGDEYGVKFRLKLEHVTSNG